MRTLIAPLDPGVESQVRGLDRKRAEIARRYIRRLALNPTSATGSRVDGWPRSSAVPSALTTIIGPRSCWRRATAHRAAATRTRRGRPAVADRVLAGRNPRSGAAAHRRARHGIAHPKPGQPSAFELAERLPTRSEERR